jgi:formylglycine-generating enzyme required for sulfatase activity
MITIPGGSFQMGSKCCETKDELPVRQVSIKAFLMSETEVSFARWDECVSDGGCTYRPSVQG